MFIQNMYQKWLILASFWKHEGLGQIVLPDRSILIRQELVENHFGYFQTDDFSNFLIFDYGIFH